MLEMRKKKKKKAGRDVWDDMSALKLSDENEIYTVSCPGCCLTLYEIIMSDEM